MCVSVCQTDIKPKGPHWRTGPGNRDKAAPNTRRTEKTEKRNKKEKGPKRENKREDRKKKGKAQEERRWISAVSRRWGQGLTLKLTPRTRAGKSACAKGTRARRR